MGCYAAQPIVQRYWPLQEFLNREPALAEAGADDVGPAESADGQVELPPQLVDVLAAAVAQLHPLQMAPNPFWESSGPSWVAWPAKSG